MPEVRNGPRLGLTTASTTCSMAWGKTLGPTAWAWSWRWSWALVVRADGAIARVYGRDLPWLGRPWETGLCRSLRWLVGVAPKSNSTTDKQRSGESSKYLAILQSQPETP